MREARKRLRVKTQRLVESPAMLRSMLATREKTFLRLLLCSTCGHLCCVANNVCTT